VTATTPSTAAQATPMTHTPDMRPDPPAEATAAEPAAAGARLRRWAILGDNPLLTLVGTGAAAVLTVLGTVAVALLIFTLNSMGDCLDRLEDTMVAGFAAQEAKFDEVDEKIAELDRKLTALIAALNMTDELDAALEGRILDLEKR